jgi:hypothetical protein
MTEFQSYILSLLKYKIVLFLLECVSFFFRSVIGVLIVVWGILMLPISLAAVFGKIILNIVKSSIK